METTAEPSLVDPLISVSATKRRFSGDYARECARKSAIARAKKRDEAEQARLIAKELRQNAIVVPANLYTAEQLNRARARIDGLWKLMEREEDPQKIDRLASAIAKLADLERILDGRPLPGSRRPKAEKSEKPAAPTLGNEFAPE